jgi:hypothetical protein
MSEMAHPYDALKQLHIYLSEGCSLTCRQCWVQTRSVNGNGNGHHLLPVVFFMQAVREALPLGLQSVQLFGTDTLTHPSLDALLDWMARFELEVGIETNGIGLTQQLAKRLACQPLSKDQLREDAFGREDDLIGRFMAEALARAICRVSNSGWWYTGRPGQSRGQVGFGLLDGRGGHGLVNLQVALGREQVVRLLRFDHLALGHQPLARQLGQGGLLLGLFLDARLLHADDGFLLGLGFTLGGGLQRSCSAFSVSRRLLVIESSRACTSSERATLGTVTLLTSRP